MYVEVKLPVNNEINVKFCRVSVVIHPMTHWQYEMICCKSVIVAICVFFPGRCNILAHIIFGRLIR